MAASDHDPSDVRDNAFSTHTTLVRGDRLLPALAVAALGLMAFWFWVGNGAEVFAGMVSAGLALCF